MPFSSNRNSREDNSNRRKSNPQSFRDNNRDKKSTPYSSSRDQDRKVDRSNNTDKDRNFSKSDRPSSFKKFDKDRKFGSSDSGNRSNFDRSKRSDSSFNKFDRTNKEGSFDKESKFNKFDRDSRPARPARDQKFNKFDRDQKPGRFKKEGTNRFDRTDDQRPRRSDDRDKPSTRRSFGERDHKEYRDRSDGNSFSKPRRSFSEKKQTDQDDDGLIRLNRYIANSGICSRRKADELIESGVISVNGEVISELGTKVDPAKDEIRYNNERLKREKMVYVLLNKPKDYITTTDDPQERKTVMQLVAKATRERIYPIGRLDRNTTGLLLLTNDGNLAEKLSHPRNNISKIYQVELSKNLTQGDFNKIQFGIELEDGFIKPDDLSFVTGASKREVGIQIHSGKNRVVRRIFESLGYEVVKLDRVVYANLTKKDLPRGRWRYLEDKEIIQLKHLIK